MDHSFTLTTDTATLVVGDPAFIRAHTRQDADWWSQKWEARSEQSRGQVTLIRLGSDGVYKVRITDQDLSPDEAAYACEAVSLGLEVTTGRVLVGSLEVMAGGEFDSHPSQGVLSLNVQSGEYALTAYSIAWHDAPDWFTSADEPVPDSAPADVVVVLSSRTQALVIPETEPRLFGTSGKWLFPELIRRLGPIPGMELSTSVVMRRDELVLKPCGPAGYRPVIHDMSTLRWKDRVRVRVLTVDHDAHEFVAQIISSTAPAAEKVF